MLYCPAIPNFVNQALILPRDLCIRQKKKPEFCSCTEIVWDMWFWKPSNTLQIILGLRSQLNSFTSSCLNWQEGYKHQQSYAGRRPTVEQSALWVLGMGLSPLQKQAWCSQFLHLWRMHRTTVSRCCHATIPTSLQVLQLLKLNWSFAAICWWLPITSGSFPGNFRCYVPACCVEVRCLTAANSTNRMVWEHVWLSYFVFICFSCLTETGTSNVVMHEGCGCTLKPFDGIC